MDRQTKRRRRIAFGLAGLCAAIVCVIMGWWLVSVLVSGTVILALSRRQGVPVLVYHSVSADAAWLPWARNISVRPEVFARHMDVLARSGWSVISDQALFDVLAGDVPSGRHVVLHFDDAYADVLANAVPVLRHHQMPATIFASSDFVDPSHGVRPDLGTAPVGYLNADELRHLDADPLFDVASHGKDHARIATGAATRPRADVGKWDTETAYLWSMIEGDKSRWFDMQPPAVSTIPANDSALTARAPDEDETTQTARVTAALTEARKDLSRVLGREVSYLCWPFDRVTPVARAAAHAAGFTRLTGARTDNRPNSGATDVSRTHINDHAAGQGALWMEALVFRAKLEVASGNLLWLPVTVLAAMRRKRFAPYLHGHAA